jgi:DNA repair exonuclease SbcCD ATPase subunit
MTTEFEARVTSILEKNLEQLNALLDRIESLEETVSEQEETIRGLTTDTEQNSEAINNLQSEQDDYRCELDEIGAEIDCHVQHNRNP